MSTQYPLTEAEMDAIHAATPGPEALAAIARLRPQAQERTEEKDRQAGDATAA